jgi:hypothetical protein
MGVSSCSSGVRQQPGIKDTGIGGLRCEELQQGVFEVEGRISKASNEEVLSLSSKAVKVCKGSAL